ncbi:MAG TPA: helicase HerA-like domain-containing protein, partial [Polyangiaceae bacterium]
MAKKPALKLGSWRYIDGSEGGNCLQLPAHHLVTHGVVVGMTGSGKTGLVTVIIEEALSAGIPTIIVDVKGDLPNLLLAFPNFEPESFRPWLEAGTDTDSDSDLGLDGVDKAVAKAATQRQALSEANIGEAELRRYCASTSVRVITPGATAGESLHVLSALERRSARWDNDPESARNALSAAISLVLRLLGRDPDPAKSREHVLLSVLAEHRLMAGNNAEIGNLIQD